MIDDINIKDKVINFLSEQLLINKEKINLSDSLFHHLGVAGDDGFDLITEYSKKFNVSLVDFNFKKYFGNESSSLIGLIYELITKKNFKNIPELTVLNLIEAVKLGELT